jgi:hypothetical protein
VWAFVVVGPLDKQYPSVEASMTSLVGPIIITPTKDGRKQLQFQDHGK